MSVQNLILHFPQTLAKNLTSFEGRISTLPKDEEAVSFLLLTPGTGAGKSFLDNFADSIAWVIALM